MLFTISTINTKIDAQNENMCGKRLFVYITAQCKKVSHYQVQRADVFVDNLSEHTEVLTEPLWRDQTRSKAAHKQQLCTYTSPLLLPRLAFHVPLLSLSVSSLP